MTSTSSNPAKSESFTFDSIGNWLNHTTSAGTTAFTANNLNQYLTVQQPNSPSAAPQYDSNGNMINDGNSRALLYDQENRMTSVTKTNFDNSTTRVESSYDGLSRRVEKRVFQNEVITQTTRYVYDGLLPVIEINWNGAAIGTGTETTYTRGLDLSGTFDGLARHNSQSDLGGAGGIGGLLAFNPSADQPNSPSALFLSDRMGNITTLVDNNDAIMAKYEYTAFGTLVNATGPLASANRYQFSSKENDYEVGLTYYLFRFYDPSFGRWINRDPIGELGGENLYESLRNNSILYVDTDGRLVETVTNPVVQQETKEVIKLVIRYPVLLLLAPLMIPGDTKRPDPQNNPPPKKEVCERDDKKCFCHYRDTDITGEEIWVGSYWTTNCKYNKSEAKSRTGTPGSPKYVCNGCTKINAWRPASPPYVPHNYNKGISGGADQWNNLVPVKVTCTPIQD